MFYDKQPKTAQEEYKNMLALIGSLSNLFSESDEPYLAYRVHENVFCKYMEAENLAREDSSADAKKDRVGIGLKTWVGRDDQKVAEFGKLKPKYAHLDGMDLVKRIAEYRNTRIQTTMNLHGLKEMIYHVVKRVPSTMQIFEAAFDMIDIDNIKIINKKGNENNIYFTDGKHTYHFSTSKNTLYMIFDDMELLDSFRVDIIADPYEALKNLIPGKASVVEVTAPPVQVAPAKPQLCLRLYSTRANGAKFIGDKSGLNQWNGARLNRKTGKYIPRDPNELYIPYPAEDRKRNPDFFPPRDTIFQLILPDGKKISAKVCQEADKNNPKAGKSIMSNPNKELGRWLLRDVFELKEQTLVTYEMLEIFNIDSVIFTKIEDLLYSIDFCETGTYEAFYEE